MPKARAAFQQVGCEAVAQRMRGRLLHHTGGGTLPPPPPRYGAVRTNSTKARSKANSTTTRRLGSRRSRTVGPVRAAMAAAWAGPRGGAMA